MHAEDVVVPGARDVRGTLDVPDGPGGKDGARTTGDDSDRTAVHDGDAVSAAVAACPPHPGFGGSRSDGRLVAVGEALAGRGVACLRFDYGEWDGGEGEQADAANAVRWLRDRYGRTGLFGYSFGAGVALLAGADLDPPPAAVAVLAPSARLSGEFDAVGALSALADAGVPLQVVYGTRDGTVDWEPVAERARALADDGRDCEVVELSADHFFVGQHGKIAGRVAPFLAGALG